MSTAELLQFAAGILAGLAIWSLASERRMIRRLRAADAVSAAHPAPLSVDTPVARYRLWRLLRAGAVVEASPGLYYLNRDGYERYRDVRRKRVLAVMAILLAILTLLRRSVR